MGWISSAILGSIGFAIGGPIGAIIGVGLGAGPSRNTEQKQLSNLEQKQYVTFITIFSLSAKIAKADGVVSQEEINTLKHLMKNDLKLDADGQNAAIKIFREAKSSNKTFEEIANDYYNAFPYDKEQLLMIVEILFIVAAADSVYHANEERMIKRIFNIFRLSDVEYSNMKSLFFEETDKYYKVLNCTKHDTPETIKRNYRKLASEYHPDKVVSKGLPEEFEAFAKNKFQEIQLAYETIKKERKF
ncbi:TerB family tellurite resistance protein [Kordia sp.]|uniref:TerB family tellurite resistance protein n=1 Tax=Kordia sp. TaxID=1965332 RepID=UPI003D6BEEB0